MSPPENLGLLFSGTHTISFPSSQAFRHSIQMVDCGA